MSLLTRAADYARYPGDPVVLRSGPSSRTSSDSTAKALGWFSIGLGLVELFGARHVTRALGVEGREGMVRAFGVREIAAGMTVLSTEQRTGLVSRIAGDVVDLVALAAAYRDDNPQKRNVGMAIAAVLGVTMLDIATAQTNIDRHRRGRGPIRDYSDRSGWPQGLRKARGVAADFRKPDDMKGIPSAAAASPVSGRTSPGSEGIATVH